MNTNLPKSICGVTEEMWLRCNNPLRLPKVLRYGRSNKGASRKCGLIACAYLLESSSAFDFAFARQIAKIVQQHYAESQPGTNFLPALREKLLATFPGELVEGALSLTLGTLRETRPQADYWRLNAFLGNLCGRTMPNRATVNITATACLNRARGQARLQVTRELEALRTAYARRSAESEPQTPLPPQPRTGWRGILDRLLPAFPGNYVKPPRPETPIFPPPGLADAVLELLPETDRARFVNETWYRGQIPVRIAHRLGTLAADKQAGEVGRQISDMIRDILGNPFRPTAIQREWCEANFGTALRIAEHIVATGSYGDVPILADALEDAGCQDEELLQHCRTGNHVPGCWVVDAVLARQ